MSLFRRIFLTLILLAPGSVLADEVRLMAPDGSVIVDGRLVGFDGEFYEVETVYGPLTLDASRVLCEGASCPDPDQFSPRVRVSGAAAMGGRLLPAMIEAFSAQNGYSAERIVESDAAFTYVLREPGAARPAVEFRFNLSNSDQGIEDLLAGRSDMALSTRPMLAEEIARGDAAGIGPMEGPGRARVVALDGLVAIVRNDNPLATISLRDTVRAFAGEITSWSELGGPDVPITLHLRDNMSGTAQRFADLMKSGYGVSPTATILRHATNEDLSLAMMADPFALGVTVLSDVGNARVLPLSGPCGYPSRASAEAFKTEDYPLTAPLFAYLPVKRLPKVARDFLAFAQSPAAASAARLAGFVDQSPDLVPMERQGLRLANAVRELGRSARVNDLRDMMDLLIDADRLTVTYRFRDGSSDLEPQSLSNVDLLAEGIARGEFDGRTVSFVGFSDGRGDAAQNRRLSERRAEAVRDAVLDVAGPAVAARVTFEAVGYGEALPIACDDVEWGQRINRRVEVWVR